MHKHRGSPYLWTWSRSSLQPKEKKARQAVMHESTVHEDEQFTGGDFDDPQRNTFSKSACG
jgi:hypothetical protein